MPFLVFSLGVTLPLLHIKLPMFPWMLPQAGLPSHECQRARDRGTSCIDDREYRSHLRRVLPTGYAADDSRATQTTAATQYAWRFTTERSTSPLKPMYKLSTVEPHAYSLPSVSPARNSLVTADIDGSSTTRRRFTDNRSGEWLSKSFPQSLSHSAKVSQCKRAS